MADGIRPPGGSASPAGAREWAHSPAVRRILTSYIPPFPPILDEKQARYSDKIEVELENITPIKIEKTA